MQFCAEPNCGVLVRVGRCAAHALRSVNWYGLARWRHLRAAVMLAEPFCRVCRARGLKVLTVDVDHIRPHRGNAGLFWDRANLQGLCRTCHSEKTARGE